MELLSIDGELLTRMIVSAANSLESNKIAVNSLNVFPVPDGDTGTNMSMTMSAAVKEMKSANASTPEDIAEAVANGSLMGARGNSGVILSQLFRGFAKGIKENKELNCKNLALALKEGANTAYKAVMKPTEGTILTVARETADKAIELSKNIQDVPTLMNQVFDYANVVLDKTPDMLPVLKKAGVVDAGGKGLIYIYKGMVDVINGKEVEYSETVDELIQDKGVSVGHTSEETDIKYGYCTEFIVKSKDADIDKFRDYLSTIGDSLIVVGSSDIIKVHFHTNEPGVALTSALELGELVKVKVDNMREQHRTLLNEKEMHMEEPAVEEEEKQAGLITVAMGEGIRDVFMDLGADEVIEGGQTMNPSTEDILHAIKKVNASDIYILPNNGNILLAAKQAASMSEKNVIVIPTKSIPQGIAALTVFNPDSSSDENEEIMVSTINYVKTGQVTYAVRNTTYDDKEINEGDILGLVDGKINNTGKDINDVTESLIMDMVSEDDELITIFYGNDIEKEDVDKLLENVHEKFPDCDIQSHNGGQPLYYYIISVE
mgnify:CR=1 FL=1